MKKQQIIISPLMTEKGDSLKQLANYHLFEVHRDANKDEIRRAVEGLAKGVQVESVRTMIVPGKRKRTGRKIGKTASWKKAVVRLKQGSKLDFFEGV